jgi:N-acetylglucosamine-6-phosphate deacetylase
MKTVITAGRLIIPDQLILNPVILVEDGVITQMGSRDSIAIVSGKQLNFPSGMLVPAFFDIHIHGSAGSDVMEGTQEAFATVGKFLAQHGVGAYLPTTVTAAIDVTLKSLEGMSIQISRETDSAKPLGIHIEGPFLSPHKKGAHPAHLLQTPSVELFDRMWQAAQGKIRLMTIAPEMPNALDLIRHAIELGVRVSLGHSNADTAAAQAGIRAGAVSATHTYNAMRQFDHRDPGLLGEVLSNDELFAELICDGLHVHPDAVRVYWKAKGADRAMLITDAMSAAGMPDGNYKLGELDVRVVNGRCVIGEDTLAGSTLTLDQAVANFARFTGASINEVSKLVSRNPARMAGVETQTGSLAVGRRADITVLSPKNEVVETILGGRATITAS